MASVAVFDSGLGSLSVVRAIRARCRCRITYLADQASYPYGLKTARELGRIVRRTVRELEERFSPDAIVAASNTPGLLLDVPGVIMVRPPLAEAARASRTGRIAFVGTRASVRSAGLARMARSLPDGCRMQRIDGTRLVDLAESGAFHRDQELCRRVISEDMRPGRGVDTVVLGSTHLALLLPLLKSALPGMSFVDPADRAAARACAAGPPEGRSSLRVYTTGDPARLRLSLAAAGLRCAVRAF
ncbi:putative Asp/Glu/hydantoin racemase [Nitrosopumilaceae archaeon]|nr:aspartate/glutamate racemase family protein [Nitrosopumilus sp.]CAI9832545.1 putative Asp/Glu/hydantoin racemase [Nitrosopumilaceae archaeon]MDA7944474.1 aspartate/glutamate racemase family protein [Nitrosopumilus sp.]MDA7954226.1 aspartate/glutamate racemase family protein [Nitrosopumilus sp.]MDA7973178.1 aspartate/glutamate racemase family protein [Nitrosopumilus sp.]